MATNDVPRGPTSTHVVDNVNRLRTGRRWSLANLSIRMTAAGRPVLSSGLHRLEQGRRRVDVDDLVALAVAFDVSPTTLLMPWTASGVVRLTEVVEADAVAAWEWMRGIRPLELPRDRHDADFVEETFQRASAPAGALPKQTRSGRKSEPCTCDREQEEMDEGLRLSEEESRG